MSRRQRGGNSPLLTFHNIKQSLIESQESAVVEPRKAFVPERSKTVMLKQSSSFGSIRKGQERVRLGSMVFASLSKRGESTERGARTERWGNEVECMNSDGQIVVISLFRLSTKW